MVFFYKYFEIFFLHKQLVKKKIGNKKKFINVKLKGWKENTVNEPRINGNRYNTIVLLFKILSSI